MKGIGYSLFTNMHTQIFLFLIGLWFMLTTSCNDTIYSQGKALYEHQCANCHMTDGTGLAGLIPPLVASDYYANHTSDIACIIYYGQKASITVNGILYEQQEMPAFPHLNAVEINNIINYINQAWGNDLGISKVKDVERTLENCKDYRDMNE